jgi:uncharacterized membrane protein YhaH (DUF805 family)
VVKATPSTFVYGPQTNDLSGGLIAFVYGLPTSMAGSGGSMLSLFFGFNGRINRVTYWLGSIVVGVAAAFGLMFGMMAAGASIDKSPEGVVRALSTMGLILGPVWLVASWAALALQVKRFHDRGRSGFYAALPFVPLLMIAVTIFGGAMANQPGQDVAAQCFIYVNILSLINIFFFVDLGCLGSKDGPNKYGDPPRGGFGAGPGPSAPAPGRTAPAHGVIGGGAALGNAEAAIQRAIAEQAKAKAAPQQVAAPARSVSPASPRPAMVTAGAPTGFGRKPAR